MKNQDKNGVADVKLDVYPKIRIDNRDLPYSIDTYGMFNGDSFEEYTRQYLAEDHGIEDPDFNYDHPKIVQALAEKSIDIIESALIIDRVEWFKGIKYQKSNSPQFYNYTTDSYVAEWEIDEAELDKVMPDNWESVAKDNGWGSYELEDHKDKDESRLVAKIDIALREHLSLDDYNNEMWEYEDEAYQENMTMDEESEKKLSASIDKEMEARKHV